MSENKPRPETGDERPELEQGEPPRFLFRVSPLWLALIADQRSPDRTVSMLFAEAIKDAAAVGHDRGECLVCRSPWSTDRPPAGALSVTPITGTESGFAGLIGACCWSGGMDERLREIVEQDFGYAPGTLKLLHSEGTA
jgi:hypothetical protein